MKDEGIIDKSNEKQADIANQLVFNPGDLCGILSFCGFGKEIADILPGELADLAQLL